MKKAMQIMGLIMGISSYYGDEVATSYGWALLGWCFRKENADPLRRHGLGESFSRERDWLGWMAEYGERLVNSSCAVDKDSRFGAL